MYSYQHLGRNGRLGNQLFQIAGTIGRAHQAGDKNQACFPAWDYSKYFCVPEQYFVGVSEITVDLGRDYLQNIDGFAECDSYIREIFAASKFASEELHEVYEELLVGHRTAVHVRRGDYVDKSEWHPLCSIQYFLTAMDAVHGTHSETTFLIFSDDIDWCRDNFADNSNLIFVTSDLEVDSTKRDMADFNLMRSCNAHIISNSTYSWWAAYLSQQSLVIAPDIWYGNELSHLDSATFLPQAWIKLSATPMGPSQVGGLDISETEDGLVVLNVLSRRVHHLNATAAILFELCTGNNSVTEIEEMMTSIRISLGLPEFDTVDILEMFVREGLIRT